MEIGGISAIQQNITLRKNKAQSEILPAAVPREHGDV